MAGSGPVRSAIHTHFANNLKFSIAVGATHWEDMDSDGDLPGPQPELFFAPGQSAKRARDWGPAELANRTARAFNDLLDHTERWLTVVHRTGPDGIEATYRELLEGQADPAIGYVCSMSEDTPALDSDRVLGTRSAGEGLRLLWYEKEIAQGGQ